MTVVRQQFTIELEIDPEGKSPLEIDAEIWAKYQETKALLHRALVNWMDDVIDGQVSA